MTHLRILSRKVNLIQSVLPKHQSSSLVGEGLKKEELTTGRPESRPGRSGEWGGERQREKKELIPKLPGTDGMGRREQGLGWGRHLQGSPLGIQRRVCYRIWGSAPDFPSGTALWVINSRPSYFLMKVTTVTSARQVGCGGRSLGVCRAEY